MIKTNKNLSIEAFRFIIICFICIWHFDGHCGILQRGYLGVDFFFILSGMLLYKSSIKENALNSVDYTLKKFFRFFPEYVFCMLFLYICQLFTGSLTLSVETIERFISEMLMLQNVGLWMDGRNWALWYICVLIVGGGLIYSFLKYDKRLSLHVIMPLLVILGFSFLFKFNKENHIESFAQSALISLPLLRGLCDMSLGVLCMAVFIKKKESMTRFLYLWSVASIISLILFLRQIFVNENDDSYCLIFLPILLMSLFLEGTILNKLFRSKIWIFLGSISFEMYLVHVPILGIISVIKSVFFINGYILTIIYLCTVFLLAILLKRMIIILNRFLGVTSL